MEPRGPSPWGWSRTERKRDKSRSRMLGSNFHLPLLFGFPEFLKLFSKKLSQRPLSTLRCQRSVLEMAWGDVTSARAPNCCQAMRPPPLSIPAPNLCPNFRSSPVPSFPPFPSWALASSRWETLAWSFVRGRVRVRCGAKTLCWAQRTLGHISLDWHRQAFPPSPLLSWKSLQMSLYFPISCVA